MGNVVRVWIFRVCQKTEKIVKTAFVYQVIQFVKPMQNAYTFLLIMFFQKIPKQTKKKTKIQKPKIQNQKIQNKIMNIIIRR